MIDLEAYAAKKAEWLAAVEASRQAHEARNQARDAANALSEEEFELRQPLTARVAELSALDSPTDEETAELAAIEAALRGD